MGGKEVNPVPDGLHPGKVQRASDASRQAASVQDGKLRKACADFEAIFLTTLLKAMRNTVPRSGLTTPMAGRDTYEMLQDQQVADSLAQKGGLGLQEMLFQQLQGKR